MKDGFWWKIGEMLGDLAFGAILFAVLAVGFVLFVWTKRLAFKYRRWRGERDQRHAPSPVGGPALAEDEWERK